VVFLKQIENSLNSANKNREEKLEEIVEKQKRQDERRRRVMRAVSMQFLCIDGFANFKIS
jgi:hypothetical protein